MALRKNLLLAVSAASLLVSTVAFAADAPATTTPAPAEAGAPVKGDAAPKAEKKATHKAHKKGHKKAKKAKKEEKKDDADRKVGLLRVRDRSFKDRHSRQNAVDAVHPRVRQAQAGVERRRNALLPLLGLGQEALRIGRARLAANRRGQRFQHAGFVLRRRKQDHVLAEQGTDLEPPRSP